jgi:phosphatidylglycerol:prolipoprotein diacylglycerol transferase
MYPVLFHLPFFGLRFPVSGHGAFLSLGLALVIFLAYRQAKHEHEVPGIIVNLMVFELLAGILGARLVYAFTARPYFIEHPFEIFMLWKPGLVWYGGFIGAALCLLFYTRLRRLVFFKYADILVPFMAFGHAFGRLGCLLGGCCFGRPTEQPWGIIFPAHSAAAQTHVLDGLIGEGMASLPVHPAQLYEAGSNFSLFLVLLLLGRHKTYHGQVSVGWCVLYPLSRFFIETFRGDNYRGVGILSTSQYLSIALLVFAGGLYFALRTTRRASMSHA